MDLNPTTLVLEALNFLVLVWLLSKLLYRPLRRALEERQQALAAERQAATDARAEAEALQAEWRDKRASLDELAAQVRAEALDSAVKDRGRMLAQAREEAAAEGQKARRMLEAEREAALVWVRNTAVDQSTQVAGELLMRLAPDTVDEILLARLLDEVQARAAQLVESLPGPGTEPVEVELVSPHLPHEATSERVRAAVQGALGRAVRLNLREDAELVGGVVLRVGETVLDASVAGQLDAFRDLARESLQERIDG